MYLSASRLEQTPALATNRLSLISFVFEVFRKVFRGPLRVCEISFFGAAVALFLRRITFFSGVLLLREEGLSSLPFLLNAGFPARFF
jgi:hypothetical protein